MRVQFACVLMLLCAACHRSSSDGNKRFSIRLSADSQSVYVSSIDYATLQELKNDSLSTENWQSMFPVFKMPADTELKDLQRELPGVYTLTDSTISFKPDTAFQKHQQYFARFYGNDTFLTTSQVVSSKAKLKRPGYIEVVFRF